MLRHANYERAHPVRAAAFEVLRGLRRPTRLLLLAFVLATAWKLGAPLDRAVPTPVKAKYYEARGWQTDNAAKLICLDRHRDALKSGQISKIRAAERDCEALLSAAGR
jgi:hypothetical protein